MSMSAVDELIQGLMARQTTPPIDWEALLAVILPNWRTLAAEIGRSSNSRDEAMDFAAAISGFRDRQHLVPLLAQAMSLDAALVLAWRCGVTHGIGTRIGMASAREWKEVRPELKAKAVLWMLEEFPGIPVGEWRRIESALRSGGDPRLVLPAGSGITNCHVGYVEDPKVADLRELFRVARDRKSQTLLKSQIETRQRAFGGASVRGNATGAASRSKGLLSEWRPQFDEEDRAVMEFLRIIEPQVDYLPPLPQIMYTEEEPPLFRAYPSLRRLARNGDGDDRRPQRGGGDVCSDEVFPEILNVESLLGLYRPQPAVILYSAGIRACAQLLGVPVPFLQAKVLVHELGHWLSHAVPVGGRREWEHASYAATSTFVHEAYAQLAAYWVCDRLGGQWFEAFMKLNDRQSAPYHAWGDFQRIGSRTIVGALTGLRRVRPGAELIDMKRALP